MKLMISIDRLKEMALEDIEKNPEKHLEEYAELSQQLDRLKAENEKLKKDNSTLKDILSYPKYTNENAYNELLKLSKAELIKNLIESHQHGESTTQVFYRSISEENKKYKQTLAEIKEIAITGLEGFCPKCSRKECEDNNCIETAIRDILQKISECEVKNDT